MQQGRKQAHMSASQSHIGKEILRAERENKSLLAHSLRPTCLNRAAIFFTSALSCASSLSFSPHCTSIISSCKRVKSISHIGSDFIAITNPIATTNFLLCLQAIHSSVSNCSLRTLETDKSLLQFRKKKKKMKNNNKTCCKKLQSSRMARRMQMWLSVSDKRERKRRTRRRRRLMADR